MLPIAVLRQNHGIDPGGQLRLASHIRENTELLWPVLSWTTATPTRANIDTACNLIWQYLLTGRPPRGARTAAQLSFLVRRFTAVPVIRELIQAELSSARGDGEGPATEAGNEPPDPDTAVENTLDFLRNWANYHFPRFLMALSRIQEAVFRDLDLPPGDYSAFATQIENYFLPPGIAAIDEYGIPLQVGQKLVGTLANPADLDATLRSLRSLDLREVDLDPFERDVVADALRYLG